MEVNSPPTKDGKWDSRMDGSGKRMESTTNASSKSEIDDASCGEEILVSERLRFASSRRHFGTTNANGIPGNDQN
ncbi:hypothetical protein BLOT_001519 [Blomia tropicalis]|nr:hypothetical protein BLOT_001519 [Blomia tropicalis]